MGRSQAFLYLCVPEAWNDVRNNLNTSDKYGNHRSFIYQEQSQYCTLSFSTTLYYYRKAEGL